MKLPHAAVFYRPATDPARRCGTCIMWRDRACTRVEGLISADGTCDIFYPARMAEAAAEAYLSGWALTEAPYTSRVHAGLGAAVAVACEHQHDPAVLEATLRLGSLTGTWALVYQRRERLQAKHERAILAAWRACLASLDPADLARRYRLAVGQHGETTDPDRQWWQDTGIAAAAAWLAGVYRADGYDTLVTTLAAAIRAGMAEGEAGALALAASKLGRTGFRIDRAFKAAYKRLAGDGSVTRQAQQTAVAMIDSAAAGTGRRLAAMQSAGASEDDMAAGVEDEANDTRSVRRIAGDVFWTAMGAGALSLFGRASQPPTGSSDSGVTVLVDWNSEPSACIICQDNTAGGPYAPQDVPPYLAHPNCVIGSTRVAAPRLGGVSLEEPVGLPAHVSAARIGVRDDASRAAAPAAAEAERDFGRANIRAVSGREYVGDVVTIRTALGYELTATPNHPVATRGGWVPVAELAVGGYVLASTGREWVASAVDPDVDEVPPRIEDVAQSFPVVLGPVPTSAEDFHGDGAGSEVHVVRADRLLVDDVPAGPAEHARQDHLGDRGVAVRGADALDAEGLGGEELLRLRLAAHGVVGSAGKPGSLLGTRLSHADVHALAAVPGLDAFLQQHPADGGPADAEGFCERFLALAGGITADEIVSVRRHPFSGHVYNLDTVEGYYIGNGIVTHNCRCWLSAASGLPAWMLAGWLAGDD